MQAFVPLCVTNGCLQLYVKFGVTEEELTAAYKVSVSLLQVSVTVQFCTTCVDVMQKFDGDEDVEKALMRMQILFSLG